MKAILHKSLFIQVGLLTAVILVGTTACWFSVCELTNRWLDFSSHIIILSLIFFVSATTAVLMFLVLHRKVFQPLHLVQRFNTKQVAECTPNDCAVMLIPEERIPRGEIGELMHSRNMMLRGLEKTLRELQENYRKVAELEKLKENLTLMIVHDLKNPLGVILLAADVLQKNIKAGEDQQELMNSVRQSGYHMLGMIQNLLDISKMEEGKIQLDLTSIDLEGMTKQIIHDLSAHGAAKQRTITVKRAPGLPDLVADRDLIRRVVENLLSNAMKHTATTGHIEILLEKSGNVVVFGVSDDGIGIPEEDQHRIYDKFEQASLRDGYHRTSSGLGLTFCKLAVEAHGGRIWVESEVGRGSSFFVELPFSQGTVHKHEENVNSSRMQLEEIMTHC